MKKLAALVLSLSVAMMFTFTGCGGGEGAGTSSGLSSAGLDKVTIQLKWLPQAQFMGYYVADEKGYYAEEGIDVEILSGSSDFTAEDQVLNGTANFGHTWYSSLLTYQEGGNSDLISIAQIYQKSALGLVAKKSSGIKTGADLKGKVVGSWYGGNEYEILALLGKYNLDKDKDVTMKQQDFTMDAFLNDEITAASAMTYNEYGLVLESGVKEEDLSFIDMNDEGVAMMQDCLVVDKKWAEQNKDLVVRFLRATLKGWREAVADPEAAGKLVYSVGKSVSEEHQIYMAKEVAKVVKPSGFSDEEIGKLDTPKLQQTIDLGLKYGLIKSAVNLSDSIDDTYLKEALK